jgi:hypothetical protein
MDRDHTTPPATYGAVQGAAYADRIDLLLHLGWDWSDAEERTG